MAKTLDTAKYDVQLVERAQAFLHGSLCGQSTMPRLRIVLRDGDHRTLFR